MILYKTCSLGWGVQLRHSVDKISKLGRLICLVFICNAHGWYYPWPVSCSCLYTFFAATILKLLGQQEDIADPAGSFSILVIPQFLSLPFNFPTQKFLQAQSKVNVIGWTGLVALILHIGILWFLIYVLDFGLAGAALAFDITSWGITVAQLVYVVIWCKDGWNGLSWLAFKDIWAFVRLSLASAVMLCLEVWYMMSVIVLAGNLDNALVAVDSLSIW